jgi:Lon protease-like protein/ActR/RegA family two-component response regulator
MKTFRDPVTASKEKFETKKLPMMPIRDVVIFPYMKTPFVVGREASVHALEEALAADKKIFLATQHDPSIDEPKPNEIYQVGTVVNVVQSLRLPDGNIKVLVEGIERGKILQVTETEGFMQASVRLACYATETNPQIEAGMQRVTGLFEQYVKLCQSLNYETMIAAVRMEDPAKLTDTIAANLQLSIEEKQELLEIFDPAERLSRIGDVLDIEIEKLKMDSTVQSRRDYLLDGVPDPKKSPRSSHMENEVSSREKRIRVLVADDTRIHTQLLADVLKRDAGLHVSSSESGSEALIASARTRRYDVLVVGSNLDEQPNRGFDVLRELCSTCPEIRTVMLLESYEPDVVRNAFRAGAKGIFSKLESVDTLCKCIRSVAQDQI